eukprot:1634238-Alexandrium_andersonii.AAC.1
MRLSALHCDVRLQLCGYMCAAIFVGDVAAGRAGANRHENSQSKLCTAAAAASTRRTLFPIQCALTRV